MPRSPNIILCTCDQLRAFEVGCYGNPVARTPHLDRLAAEGVRFETAVSNCPLCMPARSALLSGQHARTAIGHLGNAVLPASGHVWQALLPQWPAQYRREMLEWTMPEVFKALGYSTGLIGKWHIHTEPRLLGFDTSLYPQVHHRHSGQRYCEDGGEPFAVDGWSVEYEADRLREYVRQRRDHPFFLFYSISPPHCPLADAPERYRQMFDPAEIPLRPNVPTVPGLPFDAHEFKVYLWDYLYYFEGRPGTLDLPEGCDLRQVLALYYGMTTWVDDMVGRVRATIEEAGLSDDTIIVFTSDHGDMLGSHGLFQKDQLAEEAVRVPMIFHAPGRWRPAVNRAQVAQLLDVMPTLLDAAGVTPLPHLHGRSLLPILEGTREELVENHAIIECGNGDIGVRTPRWLYGIQRGQGRDRDRITNVARCFHDLAADPYQMTNLTADATAPGQPVAAALRLQLEDWHRATPWLEPRACTSFAMRFRDPAVENV
jgi:arylsulfatase A-like enzyme